MTINGGTLDVVGSPTVQAVTGPLTVNSGGTLSGNAKLGTVTVAPGGTIAPADGPNTLPTNDLTFDDGSSALFMIGGDTPGNGTTGYDQIDVTGGVTIDNSVSLSFGSFDGYIPHAGDTYDLIVNDGTDPVVGTFENSPEGTTLTNFLGSGLNAILSYAGNADGGTVGNDVVLTVQPGIPTISLNPVNITYVRPWPTASSPARRRLPGAAARSASLAFSPTRPRQGPS